MTRLEATSAASVTRLALKFWEKSRVCPTLWARHQMQTRLRRRVQEMNSPFR